MAETALRGYEALCGHSSDSWLAARRGWSSQGHLHARRAALMAAAAGAVSMLPLRAARHGARLSAGASSRFRRRNERDSGPAARMLMGTAASNICSTLRSGAGRSDREEERLGGAERDRTPGALLYTLVGADGTHVREPAHRAEAIDLAGGGRRDAHEPRSLPEVRAASPTRGRRMPGLRSPLRTSRPCFAEARSLPGSAKPRAAPSGASRPPVSSPIGGTHASPRRGD